MSQADATSLYMRGFRAGEAVAKREADDEQRRAVDRALFIGLVFGGCIGAVAVIFVAPFAAIARHIFGA